MTLAEKIKSRIVLSQYIESCGIRLKRSGRQLSGCCPFHEDKTPSFFVDDEKGLWHCFVCGGGDIFSFVMRQKRMTFREALHELAAYIGLPFEDYQPQPSGLLALHAAASYYQQLLETSEAGKSFLRQRAVHQDTALAFRLGFAPRDGDAVIAALKATGHSEEQLRRSGLIQDQGRAVFHHRLMIPIMDKRGNVVGFAGRALSPQHAKYLNNAGFRKSDVVYGLHHAASSILATQTVVIVEGYMDCIAAQQHGITNAVAIMGAAVHGRQARLLAQAGARRALLALDADAAGKKGVMQSVAVLANARIEPQIVTWSGGKDPDELLRTQPDVFLQALDAPQDAVVWLIDRACDAVHPQASVMEREHAARQVFPMLRALEHNVLRASSVQALALRLGLDERALVNFAQRDPFAQPEAQQTAQLVSTLETFVQAHKNEDTNSDDPEWLLLAALHAPNAEEARAFAQRWLEKAEPEFASGAPPVLNAVFPSAP